MHAQEALQEAMAAPHATFATIKNSIRTTVSKYIERKTGRKPMVIPVIMNTSL